jgi:EAL domain-containing protein (putative c-di-GMP-specific phosphodiesterase class I)
MKTTHQIDSKLIEAAIDRDELLLHYQPQTSVTTGKVVSMEALARWQTKTLGYVDTFQFIQVLEGSEIDLIAKFHRWVIRAAFIQIVEWRAIGISVPVFLNFSTRYLQERECLTFIQTMLQEYNLPTSCFGIEVTESCSITNMPDIQFVLQNLHEMGVEIALDDFCTSYCSLAYLTEFPVTKIKIDKQFIQNLDPKNSTPKPYQGNNPVAVVIESIIDLALKLGIEVIAEGVETMKQLEQVTYLGCDVYQGYLYYPPVPACYISGIVLKENILEVDDFPKLSGLRLLETAHW